MRRLITLISAGGNRTDMIRRDLLGDIVPGVLAPVLAILMHNGQPLTITDGRGGTIFCGSSGAAFSNVVSRAEMAPGMTYANVAPPGGIEARLGGLSGGPG